MNITVQQVPGLENIQNVPPNDPKIGQTWLDLSTGTINVWTGSVWVREGLNAAPGEPTLYVDDVFSTYLYTGNSSTQTINNGIDLAGEGGMVWLKLRSGPDAVSDHALFDTERGAGNRLATNTTSANFAGGNLLTGFTSSGFTVDASVYNDTSNSPASWTFRCAPKFFDVVTYTGNGVAGRQIPHSLGVEPGMIIVKNASQDRNWYVYHKYLGATQSLILNQTASTLTNASIWDNTLPTASVFTIGTSNNESGSTYVAYLFAHNASADGIIQCGGFTTNSSQTATVNLGWEPQFVLMKQTGTGPWVILDVMRNWNTSGAYSLFANTSASEDVGGNYATVTSTGFTAINMGVSATSVFIAIRRPNKPPTSGTQVYAGVTWSGAGGSGNRIITTGNITPDLFWIESNRTAGATPFVYDRLRGSDKYIQSTNTNAEVTYDGTRFDRMLSIALGTGNFDNSGTSYCAWAIRRFRGVFDAVCFEGQNGPWDLPHGLGVVPELIIIKARNSSSYPWVVWTTGFSNDVMLRLNTTAIPGIGTGNQIWNGPPTSTVIKLHTDNYAGSATGINYVAYLFATLPGVSKVGSYTGNGSTQNIDCGFSSGARFILIKRTDSTGDWYVWDSVRGITAANDPHLSLNTTAAEVTTDDSVDPVSTGFTVNQNTATNINVNNGTYIFLAYA